MNQVKICTVVTGTTVEEFLSNLAKVQKVSDLIELRVDYIQNLAASDIEIIKKATTKEAIFTCRAKAEGGQFSADENKRLEIIEAAGAMGFDYIDLELNTIKQKPFELKGNTKKIISYHNFEKTPDYKTLQGIVEEAKQYHPDVIKIATMVHQEEDNKVLFKLLVNQNDNIIVIGMGEKGKITRILGPFVGSFLTYAATPFSQSAPGQIMIDKLQSIYQLIS